MYMDIIYDNNTGFIITPSDTEYIVAVCENATFTCQHCGSDINTIWLLNGTSLLDDPENIKLDYSFEAVCGVMFIMTIINPAQYNQTNIQCQADLGGTSNISAPILLSVQGIRESIIILCYVHIIILLL